MSEDIFTDMIEDEPEDIATMSDRPTPETDALYVHCVRNAGPGNGLILKAHGQKLERQRDAYAETLRQIANEDRMIPYSGDFTELIRDRHPELAGNAGVLRQPGETSTNTTDGQ